jgi:hypothetical protein
MILKNCDEKHLFSNYENEQYDYQVNEYNNLCILYSLVIKLIAGEAIPKKWDLGYEQ